MCLLTSPLTNLNRSPKPETNLSLLSPLRSPSVENWGENQSTNYRFAFVNWKDVIYKFTRRRGIFFWLVINLVEMVKSLDRNRSLVCCRGSEVSWRFILLFDFSKPLALNLLHIPRTTRQQSIRQQFFFLQRGILVFTNPNWRYYSSIIHSASVWAIDRQRWNCTNTDAEKFERLGIKNCMHLTTLFCSEFWH